MSPEWLSLIEYRNKYKISVSTLRRRIRENAIKFQLVRGKYFVFDEAIETKGEAEPYIAAQLRDQEKDSDVMQLLAELKLAYQKILEEKEEQIFLLREEIVNQQTLIRVLEEAQRNPMRM